MSDQMYFELDYAEFIQSLIQKFNDRLGVNRQSLGREIYNQER